MNAGDDANGRVINVEVHAVRKSPEQRAPQAAVDERVDEGPRDDGVKARVDRPQEVEPETGGLCLVPGEGRFEVRLGERSNDKSPHYAERSRIRLRASGQVAPASG